MKSSSVNFCDMLVNLLIILDQMIEGTYESRRHPKKVAIFFSDHVGTFVVVVSMTLSVGGSGREESYSVERSVFPKTVGDLIGMSSLESHLVRLLECLDGALLAVSVPFRINGIVWTFVVILEVCDVVQSVDDIWANTAFAAGVMACGRLATVVLAVAALKIAVTLGVRSTHTLLGVDCLRDGIIERVHRKPVRLDHGHRSGRPGTTEWVGRVHIVVIVGHGVGVVVQLHVEMVTGAIHVRRCWSVQRSQDVVCSL